LRTVFALAALELGFIYLGSNRGRNVIDTISQRKIHVRFPVVGVGPIHPNGRSSGRRRKHRITLAACLTGEIGVAAGEFGRVTRTVVGVIVVGSTPCGFVVASVSGVVQDREVALGCSSAAKSSSSGAMEADGRETESGDFHLQLRLDL
jgi:hypothetical protein